MEYLLIFCGGLLGSAHCVGMCGAFALTLAAGERGWARLARRQLVYSLGRVSTYVLAGATLGYAGLRLGLELHTLGNLQGLLAVVAGLMLLAEGAFSAGLVRRPLANAKSCSAATTFASLLRSSDWRAVFVAGLANGLLPCGLVYAYLALACSTGDMLRGALVMASFGLGTVPALLATSLGGSFLTLGLRRRVLHVAAW